MTRAVVFNKGSSMLPVGHLPAKQQAIMTDLFIGMIWLFFIFRRVRRYVLERRAEKKAPFDQWCAKNIPDIRKHWGKGDLT